MTQAAHSSEQLKTLQALPLGTKIQMAQAKIIEYYQFFDGQVYISFSGGKDSTVLLDIVRKIYPDVLAVFSDTGLEYPEIRDFVKTVSNVEWLKPRKNFQQVIEEYGYPVVSKEVSSTIEMARGGNEKMLAKLNNTRLQADGSPHAFNCPKYQYLLNADFKISNKCCYYLKKAPMKSFSVKTGLHPIIGTMASESALRKKSWVQHGCNLLDSRSPKSNPLSIWTEQDILRYIKGRSLDYAAIYGSIAESGGATGNDRCCKDRVYVLYVWRPHGRYSESFSNHGQNSSTTIRLLHPQIRSG